MNKLTAAQHPRQALGSFFISILKWVDAKKLREEVRARVSPETQALFERAPGLLSWIPSTPIDEVETAIGELAGKQALHELGLVTARGLGGSMIQPVIRAAFFLFGETPDTAFGNLDRFFTLATRGLSFSYQPKVPGVGVVEARFAGSGTPPAAFEVLRGALAFVFEVSGPSGVVDPPEVVSNDARILSAYAPTRELPGTAPTAAPRSAGGAVVRYRVSWK